MFENHIVIDANFILLPFQFKIDYLYEIDNNLEGRTIFILFKQILDELEAKRLREPNATKFIICLLYTSPSPRDRQRSRMPSSA